METITVTLKHADAWLHLGVPLFACQSYTYAHSCNPTHTYILVHIHTYVHTYVHLDVYVRLCMWCAQVKS